MPPVLVKEADRKNWKISYRHRNYGMRTLHSRATSKEMAIANAKHYLGYTPDFIDAEENGE